ncbi:hypothetical protein Ptr902_11030 [Pyrenophora tritici-repentis]|nr:hypothetical protein Ptr902_11030 [Pyrenophora tritici-repentis]
MSSVPLHLFFNSVIFTRLQANDYAVLPTTENWMSGGNYNNSRFLNSSTENVHRITSDFEPYRVDLNEQIMSLNGTMMAKYKKVSISQCFDSYDDHYVSSVGNVYLIQAEATVWRNSSTWDLLRFESGDFKWEPHTNESWSNDSSDDTYQIQDFNISLPFSSSPEIYPSNGWRCPSHAASPCNTNNEYEVPRNISQWTPYQSNLKYCLVEQVTETCELQFSFAIAALIILANAVKAICMAFTVRMCGNHAALVTIGDAIASFLDHPDLTTQGRCLQTRRHVEMWWNWNEWAAKSRTDGYQRDLRKFKPTRFMWAMAPSERRWVATYWAYGFLVVFSIPCIVGSLRGKPSDLGALWRTGFGAIQGNNLLNIRTPLLRGVLLANIPQALFSYLYLAFNALYTTMLVAAEWSSYGVDRKTLRVTAPAGQQRSTYWLGLPYRYAIPMTITSGLLHWLASQSFFKVQIAITDTHTRDIVGEISTCGYSPIAIILTTVLASVIALGGAISRRLWYPAGIPLVGSNSAAISAACHAPPEDVDASLLPVQWGAVTHGREDGNGNEKIGHCCFSSLPVETPIAGRMYM